MSQLFALITAFPTVVYTVLLGFCLVYWLFVMIGALDIDLLDLDVDLEGGEEGFGAALAGVVSAIGLGGVPITIVVSFLALWGWMISALVASNLLVLLPFEWLRWLGGLGTLVAAFVGAVFLTRLCARPLRGLFVQQGRARSKHDLVGKLAEISSGKADAEWGEARVSDAGAVLVVSVRAPQGREFTHGEKVIVVDYDESSGAYLVDSAHDAFDAA